MDKSPRFVSALVGALAAFGVLGAGWAWAQEAPTTTPPTTQAPSSGDGAAGAPVTPDRGHDGRNCDKDGDGVPDNQQSDSSAEQTSL
ncbi:MAG: hypothetical protein QOG87_3559 [Actinomycetota bacterium]|jgi:hypothetical protein